MNRIKVDLTISVPEDAQNDIRELKYIQAEFDASDTLEAYKVTVERYYNRKVELLNRVADQLADTDLLVSYLKEEIRMHIRS